jgi:ParB/RepB/Spo0J family partition protein
MATTIQETGRRVALGEIRVPENVRDLDPEHVKALAGSIALQGMLVPVVVRDGDDGFELVAGFHRIAAAKTLGLTDVPVVMRDVDSEDADRAVENITRKQLNAFEEARAVRAMLDRGLTEDGAAQALGWPKSRVTARVKILELPERAQQLIGDGVIHLAAVDQLRAIGKTAPGLLDAVIAYLDDGNAWAAERLTREPGWVLDAALTHSGDGKVFAAYLHCASSREIAELRLGKKTEQLYELAETLHRQLDRYAYGPPQVRFSDEDVDQARAAGVLIEFERGRPIIVDRPLYRELVKTAIKRTHDDLEAKAAAAAQEKKTARAANQPVDPVTVAKRERDAQLRELTDQAHGANLDLGHALITSLTSVDPTDINVARFFVYALLGADHDSSPYTQTGERIAPDRRRRRAPGDRRAARRRHQDAQGRHPRAAAHRLRRPPRPAGRARVAVEVRRRRQDRRRALRPRADGDRRRATRHPARGALQPAHARDPLELAQGHRRQGAEEAGRPAHPRVADQARAGCQARPRRLREGRGPGPRAAARRAPAGRARHRRRDRRRARRGPRRRRVARAPPAGGPTPPPDGGTP